jgi:signal transduction histidine kinase
MVYAYLSFFVLVPCMIAIIFAQHYFFGRTNIYFSFLAFCTLLLASLVFLKVTPEIEEYVEKRLFKRKFEYKKALRDLSEIIISFLDEKELFKKTGNILTKDLGAEKVSFFLLDKEKKAYTLRSSQNMLRSKVKELPMQDLFLKWLEEKKRTVVREVLERSMDDPDIRLVIKRLESMESEVCIPLMSRDHLIGIINLGHKRSGDMYSHEDLDLLTHFAAQASIALENARLYQEMQRTQQLMRRSDRMASLGSLTAGLAHEIRNPLVAVKTFLDLLPERYKDKEFRVDFLKLTSSELDRITNLVSELLNFAKPTKPKFRKTDVNQVIEEIIPLIQVEATKRDIAIETNLLETPKAMLDADQMKQVFLNIFLNAIEAIKDHGRISITSRDIQKNGSEYVQVEIADTGKGIPKRIMEQIFDPFFTTKEKGAGLGLAITHQIVQDHHGTIEVESMPKKGTTFFINIPC